MSTAVPSATPGAISRYMSEECARPGIAATTPMAASTTICSARRRPAVAGSSPASSSRPRYATEPIMMVSHHEDGSAYTRATSGSVSLRVSTHIITTPAATSPTTRRSPTRRKPNSSTSGHST